MCNATGTTVVSVTTGVSECVGSTPRPPVAEERLLVSPRSDSLLSHFPFLELVAGCLHVSLRNFASLVYLRMFLNAEIHVFGLFQGFNFFFF